MGTLTNMALTFYSRVDLTSLNGLTLCDTNVSKHEMRYTISCEMKMRVNRHILCVFWGIEFDGAEIQE